MAGSSVPPSERDTRSLRRQIAEDDDVIEIGQAHASTADSEKELSIS